MKTVNQILVWIEEKRKELNEFEPELQDYWVIEEQLELLKELEKYIKSV